jgi:hypothetical protein
MVSAKLTCCNECASQTPASGAIQIYAPHNSFAVGDSGMSTHQTGFMAVDQNAKRGNELCHIFEGTYSASSLYSGAAACGGRTGWERQAGMFNREANI